MTTNAELGLDVSHPGAGRRIPWFFRAGGPRRRDRQDFAVRIPDPVPDQRAVGGPARTRATGFKRPRREPNWFPPRWTRASGHRDGIAVPPDQKTVRCPLALLGPVFK